MKSLTKDDVKRVYEELLDSNGSTNNLEIKEKLRSDGFWATQAEVSKLMQEIDSEEGLDYTYNGQYRVYHKPGASTSIPPYSSYSTATAVKPKKVRVPLDPGDRDPISDQDYDNGDWKAWSASHPNILYFKGKLSAGQAKYAFALHTGVDYTEARVNRINNN